ncbi:hypothetical protein E8E13_009330 [Curvularia kusanoi]|uniref:Uncharacterized protein n=1 Tax=Curvularia kusanoi TaxID=90978 RepID=A0A9P4TDY9_CURKU|nr:hypothetical protein E8E13_009330 [Curvularia kusanoi]
MNADAALWQQGNGPFQQTPLDPIRERNVMTPDIPVRNPSRPSFRKGFKDTLPSISSRYSTGTFDERLQEEGHEEARGVPFGTNSTSPLDLTSALSDIPTKDSALESSAAEPVRDQLIAWAGQQQRSDSVQLDNESYLDLQGNKLTTFKRGSIVADSIPFTSENMEASDRLQALSFAQDYHNILADPDFDNRAESRQHMPPLPPPKDQDPTPRPLTWRKDSGQLPSAEPSQRIQRPRMPPCSSSWRHRNIHKMSSWVNHRLGKESHGGAKQRAASDSALLSHSQASEHEADRHFRHEIRLTNIVQHGKDLVSRTILRRESEPKKALVISHPLPHHDPQDPTNASISATPFELATPVLRLPGGLTVVRQSSRPDTQPQTAESPSSPFSDLSWPDFPASSPFRRDFSRRGSWQSTQSQARSGSSSLFGQKRPSPLAGSPSASRSLSHSTTELGTSARDSALHYTPPTTMRRRSHNIGSPLSTPPSQQITGAGQCSEEGLEGSHKFNLIERAKGAHEAWRKHQREVKNEKLKQSIKLVGPADAGDIAGFIKCAVDGRLSGDSGVGEGRFAGSEGKGG